jgi:hypothetical protein
LAKYPSALRLPLTLSAGRPRTSPIRGIVRPQPGQVAEDALLVNGEAVALLHLAPPADDDVGGIRHGRDADHRQERPVHGVPGILVRVQAG